MHSQHDHVKSRNPVSAVCSSRVACSSPVTASVICHSRGRTERSPADMNASKQCCARTRPTGDEGESVDCSSRAPRTLAPQEQEEMHTRTKSAANEPKRQRLPTSTRWRQHLPACPSSRRAKGRDGSGALRRHNRRHLADEVSRSRVGWAHLATLTPGARTRGHHRARRRARRSQTIRRRRGGRARVSLRAVGLHDDSALRVARPPAGNPLQTATTRYRRARKRALPARASCVARPATTGAETRRRAGGSRVPPRRVSD